MVDWNNCEHEWEIAPGDHDGPEGREFFVCKHCGVPGERDDPSDAIYWPAT